MGFRLRCQWRQGRQCCPEASPGGPASCSRHADRARRPRRCPATTIAQAASAAGPPTGLGRVPLWCPRTAGPPALPPRSIAARPPHLARPAAARPARLARPERRRASGAACMSSCRGRACPTGTGPPGAGKARWAGAGSRSRSCERLRMGCPWSRLTGRTGSLSAAADQTPCDLRVTAGCAFGRGRLERLIGAVDGAADWRGQLAGPVRSAGRSSGFRVSPKDPAPPAVSELTASWNKPRTTGSSEG